MSNKAKYTDCVKCAFAPFVKASGRSDIKDKLKATPPPFAIRNEQFKKFGKLRSGDFMPLILPNGGFFFPFYIGDTRCFAFSSFVDDISINNALDNWLNENEAVIEFVDQSTFLFLSYFAQGYYTLLPEFQNRLRADEILSIAEFSGYAGHSIDDIILYYSPTYIISLPTDSLLIDADPFIVATDLLCIVPSFPSQIIDNEFSDEIHALLSFPSINVENLFLALTATRWRYAYLEIFRVLESILHVPWVIDLMKDLGNTSPLPEVYILLRKSLSWREMKGDSIERIFASMNSDSDLILEEHRIDIFYDLMSKDDFDRRNIGRRIYKIRNQLVHPEDYSDGSKLDIKENEFRLLSIYLAKILRKIYTTYDPMMRRPL